MKKYFSLILALLLCLSFAACSGAGKNAINNSDFKVSDYEDGISVDGYVGQAEDVVIPSKINGKKVRAIGANAFRKDRVLTSVRIPDTVKEIGDYAFYYCEKLTAVEIGSEVETIGKYAFGNSYAITSFTINGKALKRISDYAFSHVESLEYIKFPENVEFVGAGAFEDAFQLTLGVKEGSYLHNYAKENEIPFIAY